MTWVRPLGFDTRETAPSSHVKPRVWASFFKNSYLIKYFLIKYFYTRKFKKIPISNYTFFKNNIIPKFNFSNKL